LVELYNSISDNEAIYNEESSNILVKTEETKEIIADAEKLEQAVIAEKEKAAEEKAEVVQEKQPEAETVAEEPKEEITDEASGFQGQTEARQFDIRLSGDFDRDRPTSDNDAAAVKNVLKNAGIEAEVQPSEADFSSVSINTMTPPEAVMNALGDMVDESLEYKDELSEEKK
jgi:dsDNA-specific endonuclease/ATPase MutS2